MADISIQGSGSFQFSPAALSGALQSRGVDEANIQKALQVMAQGDAAPLPQLGIGVRVGAGPSPEMPPVLGSGSSGAEVQNTVASLETKNASGFNMVDVMKVMFEASKEMREANREMRHAERDSAMAQSFSAADKIRSAALTSMIFGIVGGAVSIGSGIVSAGQSSAQLRDLGIAGKNVDLAQRDFELGLADKKLGDSQMQLLDERKTLAGMKQPPAADPQAIKAQEQKIAGLEVQVKTQAAEAGKLGDARHRELSVEIDQNKAEMKLLDDKIAKAEGKPGSEGLLEGLRNERSALAEKNSGLESLHTQLSVKGATVYGNPLGATESEVRAFSESSSAAAKKDGPLAKHLADAQSRLGTLQSESQLKSAKLQGVNSAVGGVSQTLNGIGGMVAANEQAKGQEMTAEAQKSSSQEGEMADYQKSFEDTIQGIMDLLKSVAQSQAQVNSQIFQNM